MLAVQSLPFLAATALASSKARASTRFAYWRSVEAKVAENLQRPAPVVEAPAQLQLPVLPVLPADTRVEAQ